VQNFEVKG